MAIRVARIYRKTPTVNVYEIDDNMALIQGLVYNSNCLLNEQKNNEKRKVHNDTGDAVLAECAVRDQIWGIGLSMGDPNRFVFDRY